MGRRKREEEGTGKEESGKIKKKRAYGWFREIRREGMKGKRRDNKEYKGVEWKRNGRAKKKKMEWEGKGREEFLSKTK